MFFNVGFIGLSRGHNVVVCVMANKKTAHFVIYRLVENVFTRTGKYIHTDQEGKSLTGKTIDVEETDITLKERCHRVVRVASTPQEHGLLHEFNKWYYGDTFNDLAKLTTDIKKIELMLNKETTEASVPTNLTNELLYKLSEITQRLNFLEQRVQNMAESSSKKEEYSLFAESP